VLLARAGSQTLINEGEIMSDELIAAAKLPNIGYSEKDWDKTVASVTPDFVYDEVASHRKSENAEGYIEMCKGWATAFPESRATFHNAYVIGNTVVLELTWNGTHTGPMMTPNGEVPATGKNISMRACQVVEIKDGKAASMVQYFDINTMLAQLGVG
jgi:steroid delta-isomerase-like uncharacterized protein